MDYIYMVVDDYKREIYIMNIDLFFRDLLVLVIILVSRDFFNCLIDYIEIGLGIVLWSVFDENIFYSDYGSEK